MALLRMFRQKLPGAPDRIDLRLGAVRVSRILVRQRNQHLRVVIVLQLNCDFVILTEKLNGRFQAMVAEGLGPKEPVQRSEVLDQSSEATIKKDRGPFGIVC